MKAPGLELARLFTPKGLNWFPPGRAPPPGRAKRPAPMFPPGCAKLPGAVLPNPIPAVAGREFLKSPSAIGRLPAPLKPGLPKPALFPGDEFRMALLVWAWMAAAKLARACWIWASVKGCEL